METLVVLIALWAIALVVILGPAAALALRQDEVPPGVYWGALIGLIAAPAVGWFVVLWAALHDFSDWNEN